jgi:hypothetical protein
MGKDARLKKERRHNREIEENEIKSELFFRGLDYEQEFIKQFGKIDEDNDYEQSEDKESFIGERVKFWSDRVPKEIKTKADKYDMIVLDNIRIVYLKRAIVDKLDHDKIKSITGTIKYNDSKIDELIK